MPPAVVPPAARPLLDRREAVAATSPRKAFTPIQRIGGERGWYCANALWRLRGTLDVVAGGVGMRRGRRDPETCEVGDALDFCRVTAFEPDNGVIHVIDTVLMPKK